MSAAVIAVLFAFVAGVYIGYKVGYAGGRFSYLKDHYYGDGPK
jgi:ABC-type dipeptide/oligopeptide/nickel transport system permease subunit